MRPTTVFLFAGVLGWVLVALGFWAGFARRRSLIRLTWALAATAAVYLGLYRLNLPPPYWLRVGLDVALMMGGIGCGVALTATFLQRGPEVFR